MYHALIMNRGSQVVILCLGSCILIGVLCAWLGFIQGVKQLQWIGGWITCFALMSIVVVVHASRTLSSGELEDQYLSGDIDR